MNSILLLVLMSLAAYRLTRLVVRDTLPPVLWVRDRLAGGWRDLTLEELEIHRLPVLKEGQQTTVAGLGAMTRSEDGALQRYVERKDWSPYWMADLLTCPWCASAYTSGAVVGLTWWLVGVPVPFLAWLAVWAVAAVLASRESL